MDTLVFSDVKLNLASIILKASELAKSGREEEEISFNCPTGYDTSNAINKDLNTETECLCHYLKDKLTAKFLSL